MTPRVFSSLFVLFFSAGIILTAASAPAETNEYQYIGKWHGVVESAYKLRGEITIAVSADKTFKLAVDTTQPPYDPVRYPEANHVQAEGTWKVGEDENLYLNAEIKNFTRNEGPRQEASKLEQLPMKNPIQIFKKSDGSYSMAVTGFHAKNKSLPGFPAPDGITVFCEVLKKISDKPDPNAKVTSWAPTPTEATLPPEQPTQVRNEVTGNVTVIDGTASPVGDWIMPKPYGFQLSFEKDGGVAGEILNNEMLFALKGTWSIIPEGRWKGYALIKGNVTFWTENDKSIKPDKTDFEALLLPMPGKLAYIKGLAFIDSRGIVFQPVPGDIPPYFKPKPYDG